MAEQAMLLTGRTIVVVEDQPHPRDAIVMQLNGAGARAIGCASAEELDDLLAAVETGTVVEPDLLLLDLTLPGRSGMDTLHHLRALARWSALPVVVVSADDEGEVIDEALRAGCRGYLSKPVRAQHLIATCARVMS